MLTKMPAMHQTAGDTPEERMRRSSVGRKEVGVVTSGKRCQDMARGGGETGNAQRAVSRTKSNKVVGRNKKEECC